MKEIKTKRPKLKYDDWQKDILKWEPDEKERHLLLCTGRQVGKTQIMSRKAARYMMKNPNSQILVVSLTEDQAQLIIVMTLAFLEDTYPHVILMGKKRPTKGQIHLKNGSNILARPVGSTGDALRGFTGHVLIIDEAGKMPEFVFTSSKPTLMTTGGQIWMCSTPHGKKGYFYECFVNKSGNWKVIHKSSEEVINNRELSEAWTQQRRDGALAHLKQEKEEMSELAYGTEYLGLFLDDFNQFFSDELIEKCCILKRPETINRSTPKFMGCDLARYGGDEITYEIVEVRQNLIKHVESIVKKNQSTVLTEQEIIAQSNKWDVDKIGIDSGSGTLGVAIYDHLIEVDETKHKIVPMDNRTMTLDRDGKQKQRMQKETYYFNLRALMERGEILLLDDMEVILSLKSVMMEVIITGDQPSRIEIKGNYTHIAEGLTRAAELAKKAKGLSFWIDYV